MIEHILKNVHKINCVCFSEINELIIMKITMTMKS